MEHVIAELLNPVWWLSVVVGSLIMGVLSAYLKQVIDNFAAKYSKSRQEAKYQGNLKQHVHVESLIEHPEFLQIEILEEQRHRFRTTLYILLGAISLTVQQQSVSSPVTSSESGWVKYAMIAMNLLATMTVIMMGLISQQRAIALKDNINLALMVLKKKRDKQKEIERTGMPDGYGPNSQS